MTQPTSGVEHHDVHESHGHSVAAWTAVLVIMLGALLMALAVLFVQVWLFVVGAVVVVIGAVLGKVLAMAGFGQFASTREAANRSGEAQADLPGRNQNDSGTA